MLTNLVCDLYSTCICEHCLACEALPIRPFHVRVRNVLRLLMRRDVTSHPEYTLSQTWGTSVHVLIMGILTVLVVLSVAAGTYGIVQKS